LSEKKTGSRDISELKQRLGLKKGAAAAPAGSSSRANGAPSGGVVAPPGLNLPPPPPAMPNADDDPFGAMNAMAAVGTVQRAPEIVVVNDGNVERVHAQSSAATLLRLAVPAAIALIVGIAVAKIGTSNSSYNDGLKGAKAILGDTNTASTVKFLKKALSDLDNSLDKSKGTFGFKPSLEVDGELKALSAKLEVKQEMLRVLHQAEHQLTDPEVVGQLLTFYAEVAEVKDLVDQHNKAALGDDLALKKGKEAAAAAPKYGVLLQAPSENENLPFGGKVVELAGVYCGGSSAPVAKCGDNEAPSAYAYRNDPGSTPVKGDYIDRGSDNLPPKKIVPLVANGISDGFIKGTEATLSEVAYTRRLKALYELVHGKTGQDGKPQGGVLDDGNKLQTKLETETAKGSKFSFFM
jgi:hypothetical protein